MCDKKILSFLSTLANFWKFSVTEASSALLHFSYFFWIDYFSRGESLSQLDLLGIVGDAEGHEGKGPKIWPTFGLNYVKSIQFWAMNWQCFGNVFTIVTWLPNWKALTDWPTFWKAKKLHFGQRHLWLISNLLSGKIGYDLFNEKWIVS